MSMINTHIMRGGGLSECRILRNCSSLTVNCSGIFNGKFQWLHGFQSWPIIFVKLHAKCLCEKFVKQCLCYIVMKLVFSSIGIYRDGGYIRSILPWERDERRGQPLYLLRCWKFSGIYCWSTTGVLHLFGGGIMDLSVLVHDHYLLFYLVGIWTCGLLLQSITL